MQYRRIPHGIIPSFLFIICSIDNILAITFADGEMLWERSDELPH